MRVTLVDTSVWIDLWRGSRAVSALAQIHDDGQVLLHPWVFGEIALGNLDAKRAAILRDLTVLPMAPIALHVEVLTMINRYGLAATGLGWVDMHLIASARLASADLWTSDRRLARAWNAVH